MLDNQEFEELVEDLNSKDLSLLVATLKTLQQEPSADERILPHLERLLNNDTPCIVMLPYRFGEIRWLAAHVLAKESMVLERKEPLCLPGVVKPLSTEEIVALQTEAGVQSRGGVEGVLETFAILHGMGKLPLYDLEFLQETNQERFKQLTIQQLKESQFKPSYISSYNNFYIVFASISNIVAIVLVIINLNWFISSDQAKVVAAVAAFAVQAINWLIYSGFKGQSKDSDEYQIRKKRHNIKSR